MRSIFCLFLLVSSSAVAIIEMASGESVKKCLDVDLNSPPGTTCVTSKRVSFIRTQNGGALGWKDAASGKTWYDLTSSGTNKYMAEIYCRTQVAQKMPSRTDFQSSELNGFREILRDRNQKFFWSSTPHPWFEDGGSYIFEGDTGIIDYGAIDEIERDDSDSVAVRCVSI